MVKRQENGNTVIYAWWKGSPDDHIPDDSPKIIVEPSSGIKGEVAGIKMVGYGGFFMNAEAAKELSEGLEAAIKIAAKLDKELSLNES